MQFAGSRGAGIAGCRALLWFRQREWVERSGVGRLASGKRTDGHEFARVYPFASAAVAVDPPDLRHAGSATGADTAEASALGECVGCDRDVARVGAIRGLADRESGREPRTRDDRRFRRSDGRGHAGVVARSDRCGEFRPLRTRPRTRRAGGARAKSVAATFAERAVRRPVRRQCDRGGSGDHGRETAQDAGGGRHRRTRRRAAAKKAGGAALAGCVSQLVSDGVEQARGEEHARALHRSIGESRRRDGRGKPAHRRERPAEPPEGERRSVAGESAHRGDDDRQRAVEIGNPR